MYEEYVPSVENTVQPDENIKHGNNCGTLTLHFVSPFKMYINPIFMMKIRGKKFTKDKKKLIR